MYLKHLSLTNFRNFARLDLDLPKRVILLVGSNAQGKTSILESIYFLASFASFQTHTDRQLVNFLEARNPLAVARLVAEYERGRQEHRPSSSATSARRRSYSGRGTRRTRRPNRMFSATLKCGNNA